MSNVTKCASCGKYFNAGTYQKCPYCHGEILAAASGEITAVEGTYKPEKRSWFSSLSGKRKAKPPIKAEEPAIVAPSVILPDFQSQEMPPREEVHIPKTTSLDCDAEIDTPSSSDQTQTLSLQQQISLSGKTVGKYISSQGEEDIAPVVGWLVGVKGKSYGQSFVLKNGKNRIGRSMDMDVKLMNDDSVSRALAATVVFDSKKREFSLLPGESDSLCYVNGDAVYERRTLKEYDEIEFGDSDLNKYMIIPLCGDRFSWSDFPV